jgi:hypothetical protein
MRAAALGFFHTSSAMDRPQQAGRPFLDIDELKNVEKPAHAA